MEEHINLSITGFYGTGSSALIDLLSEYEDVRIASPCSREYEHVPFYCSGGLFDLGAILLNSCSHFNSDAAINNFIACAERLNNNDFGWYGSYRAYFKDDRFMKINQDLVASIATIKDRKTTNHTIKTTFSPTKAILQIGAKIILKRPIDKLGRKYVFDKKPMYFSLPTKEEFNKAAKKYTQAYMELFTDLERISVFDHLIWPQQVDKIEDYFADNFKTIIVDRDPRDVFLLNKYFWHKPPNSTAKPYFSTDAEKFVEEWKRLITKVYSTENILTVHFEDLIYQYEKTIADISIFLLLDEKLHLRKREKFEPVQSIENTQIFMLNEEWYKEVEIIREKLDFCCYDFPYKRMPDKSKWFDNYQPPIEKKKMRNN